MEKVLVYVNPVCKNADGSFEYDFFFSDTPEYVWGRDWDVANPSSLSYTIPDETTYQECYRVKTHLPLKTAEETNCYPIEYAIYRIMALCWIDIENLSVYPENGRFVLKFGDSKEYVTAELNKYDWKMI